MIYLWQSQNLKECDEIITYCHELLGQVVLGDLVEKELNVLLRERDQGYAVQTNHHKYYSNFFFYFRFIIQIILIHSRK